jgi:hypothetical protein
MSMASSSVRKFGIEMNCLKLDQSLFAASEEVYVGPRSNPNLRKSLLAPYVNIGWCGIEALLHHTTEVLRTTSVFYPIAASHKPLSAGTDTLASLEKANIACPSFPSFNPFPNFALALSLFILTNAVSNCISTIIAS